MLDEGSLQTRSESARDTIARQLWQDAGCWMLDNEQ